MTETLLEIDRLEVCFTTRRGVVRAVRGVSLSIAKGETLGLVGESGSGKSVTSQAAMGLVHVPGEIAGGDIRWKGQTLLGPEGQARARKIRGREMAMIFQDAMTSLNPLFTCGQQIVEVLRHHMGMNKAQARDRALELFELVG
ncbi:MAG: ABC transporter ATP-binding protein, partial [Maritimibacter sp.]|nr:ABC transporter ATP-binding protein [Maritimibacter sp.]